MRDSRGNSHPIIWKSKVVRRVISSKLAAKAVSMVEAVEWAEYIKFLWEEIMGEEGIANIIIYTDSKTLEMALKTARSIKNHMMRIDLALIREKIEKGMIKMIQWIDGEKQLVDSLTKREANRKVIMAKVQGMKKQR